MSNVCAVRSLKACLPQGSRVLDQIVIVWLPHEADPKRSDYRVELTHSVGTEQVCRCRHCGLLYSED